MDAQPPAAPRSADDGANEDDARLKLLPQSAGQFASREYWDEFFERIKAGDGAAFEWYGTWADLERATKRELHGVEPAKADVLVVGCGNSSMSQDMYKDGFTRISNVDFSEGVIEEMRTKTTDCPGMEWLVMDMLNMDAAWAERFDVVFDKGALDALVADASEPALAKGRSMLAEVTRVLKPGGTYMCVTLAQDHILKLLLESFGSAGFKITAHPFEPKAGSLLLPFLFCIEKASRTPTWQVYVDEDVCEEATGDVAAFAAIIEDKRLVYHMHQKMKSNGGRGLRGKFTLWGRDGESTVPRYYVSVLDTGVPREKVSYPCAVFLVPQGREQEWLFASEEGQISIGHGNEIGRLIVVSLSREHTFESLEDVQCELSPSMLQLIPPYVDPERLRGTIPYMTLTPDLGKRDELARVTSPLSGELVVEDIVVVEEFEAEPRRHRKLVFLSNSDVVQSEAKLLEPKKPTRTAAKKGGAGKKGGAKKRKGGSAKGAPPADQTGEPYVVLPVDQRFLAFEFHQAMVAALFLLGKRAATPKEDLLVVGLGGGALAGYLANHVGWFTEQAFVEAVEMDQVVVDLATAWFGFNAKSRKPVRVHIDEGAAFLRRSPVKAGQAYRAIFIDVDAKDLTQPVLFPPPDFLEVALLEHLRDNVLAADGTSALIINLACKSLSSKTALLARVRAIFPCVYCMSMHVIGDNNVVIVALTSAPKDGSESWLAAARRKAMRAAGIGTSANQVSKADYPHDFEGMLRSCKEVNEAGAIVPPS